jgi:hypothetical protein
MKQLTSLSELDLITMAWYYLGRKLHRLEVENEKKTTTRNRVLLKRWKIQEQELHARMVELEKEREENDL